jgi:hypothetical protein
MTDIIEKLTQIADSKTGGSMPECLDGFNDWVPKLAQIAADAIVEITRLRAELAHAQAGTGPYGPSFADIKRDIRAQK